jgi:hypothetical protein
MVLLLMYITFYDYGVAIGRGQVKDLFLAYALDLS